MWAQPRGRAIAERGGQEAENRLNGKLGSEKETKNVSLKVGTQILQHKYRELGFRFYRHFCSDV